METIGLISDLISTLGNAIDAWKVIRDSAAYWTYLRASRQSRLP